MVGASRERSARLSGRMRMLTMRPAPVCTGACAGEAEPVRMKRPGAGSSSMARRTLSQVSGSRCHSSRTTG